MLLSTAYLPSIHYFKKIVSAEKVFIEKYEHFVKQSYRNRCHILGANGVQVLSVPLVNTHKKILISEKKIAYKQNWQRQHWRSIESAYRNSPFFIYYADELKVFYENKFEFLFEYNTQLLRTLLLLLKLNKEIHFTENFEEEVKDDLRDIISIKEQDTLDLIPYTQVFSNKHGFQANLSIIDLLFNKGPESVELI